MGGYLHSAPDVRTHHSLRSGPLQPTLWASAGAPRANPASWPIPARFDLILLKLSQNGIVSSKSVQKACHSPYFQNLVQKSPLGFLRFPISSAFSHKELMGHFSPEAEIIVKMTKCRRYVHPCHTRKGRSDTPTVIAASCPDDRSSSDLGARDPDGILNAPTFNGFTGDYDWNTVLRTA